MTSCSELIRALEQGEYDSHLRRLYALDGRTESLACAKTRAAQLIREFQRHFPHHTSAALFSSPGRTEIGGNHTDHQHGTVLCAGVDLDILCCAAPNECDAIRIHSEGYPVIDVSLKELSPLPQERSTSAALVRGIAARFSQLGFPLRGFDACITSNVLSGSGLSSSAAYEVLIGTVLNHFSCGNSLDPIEIAKIGQYAENVYFGKPCGLMDQMAAAVGGITFIDFRDPAAPVVEGIDCDFSRSGHALCIVDTGSHHADLTDDYAQILRDMGAVAAHFGKTVLRDVPEAEFYDAIPALRASAGSRAILRAIHFYDDNRRASLEAQALSAGDFDRFLTLVKASGISSSLHLQNTWSLSAPEQQPIPLALALGEQLLQGRGAIRVHGGGFAGTIQAFVPNDAVSAFKDGMESCFGAGSCHILRIRPQGGCVVIP